MRCRTVALIILPLLGTTGCQVTRMDHPSTRVAAASDRNTKLPPTASGSPEIVQLAFTPDQSAATDTRREIEAIRASQLTTDGPLTLQDLQSLALEHSPILQHGAARMRAASGRHLQAGLYPNPILAYQGMEIGNRGTAGQQGGFVRQQFVTAGKLERDQAVTASEYDAQHASYHAARERVLTDVRSHFYVTLIADERLTLSQRLLSIADDMLAATRKLSDGGRATENTLLQAEIEVAQARIVRDNAANAKTEAWARLAAVTGVPDLAASGLSGSIDTITNHGDSDAILDNLLTSHPLLEAAHARICKAQATIDRARVEPIPNIDFLGGARRIQPTDSNAATAQVGIEIPLFDDNAGNIAAAEAELAAARAEARRIELRLRQSFATVYRQYANARQQAQRYRDEILPKAESSLELVRTGYAQGQTEYLTLLNAQQKFIEVNLAYVDSLEQLQLAAALVDGRLLSDSLAAD